MADVVDGNSMPNCLFNKMCDFVEEARLYSYFLLTCELIINSIIIKILGFVNIEVDWPTLRLGGLTNDTVMAS